MRRLPVSSGRKEGEGEIEETLVGGRVGHVGREVDRTSVDLDWRKLTFNLYFYFSLFCLLG